MLYSIDIYNIKFVQIWKPRVNLNTFFISDFAKWGKLNCQQLPNEGSKRENSICIYIYIVKERIVYIYI